MRFFSFWLECMQGKLSADCMWLVMAFGWSFAEATLFFIVPDVFLTYLVLFDIRLAFLGCLVALLGALLGGGVMYQWGRRNGEVALKVVSVLPGISSTLIQREKRHLKEKGARSILVGPLKGIPYKIYAICSPACKISFLLFLLISIPARLSRFLFSVVIAELAFHYVLASVTLGHKIVLLSGFWFFFYLGYFWKMRKGG